MRGSEPMTPTPLYQALTRPPAWGGVPIAHWLVVAVLAVTALQLSKSFIAAFFVAVPAYGIIRFAAWKDPYFFDCWVLRLRKTPPQRNAQYWGGSSYAPW